MNYGIEFWVAQGLALVSSVLFTISILQKTKKNLISLQIGDTVMGVSSALLLQNYPAAVTGSMALIRNLLIRFNKDKKIVMYAIAFITLTVSLVFNTKGIFGILPAIGGAEYTIGLAYAKNVKQIKIASLINTSLWCIHDWVLGIYSYAIRDTVNIVLLVIEIVKKTNKEDKFEISEKNLK